MQCVNPIAMGLTYTFTSTSTAVAGILLSTTSLPSSVKARYKSFEGINILLNLLVSINNSSFIIMGMADKLHVCQVCVASWGVRTSSYKTIHMQKNPNSSPHSFICCTPSKGRNLFQDKSPQRLKSSFVWENFRLSICRLRSCNHACSSWFGQQQHLEVPFKVPWNSCIAWSWTGRLSVWVEERVCITAEVRSCMESATEQGAEPSSLAVHPMTSDRHTSNEYIYAPLPSNQ